MAGMGDQDSFDSLLSDARALEASGELVEATRLLREASLVNPGHGVPFSRLSVIAARRAWGDASAPRAAARSAAPRVSMTTLGANGRFGNQLLQYAYLRLYAARAGAVAETPDWIGRYIFAIDDPLADGSLPEIAEPQFDAPLAIRKASRPSANVDLRGYFAFDTVHYREARDEFRGSFVLRESVSEIVDATWARLGGNERPVVAIHIRRGDFGYGRFWLAPVKWYSEWLEELLPRLDRPIVYLASDDPAVQNEFARFDPVIASDLNGFPEDLEYLTDFFMLQKAHALAISNSTFSFVAAMLGRADAVRVRPDPARRGLVPFDPWSARVLLDPPWWGREASVTETEQTLIRALIPDQAVVFDIGANRGDWSRAVLEAVAPARLFPFEPLPEAFEEVASWRELYGLENVEPVDRAAVDIRIDDFCRENVVRHIHYLRLGATGDELEVIRGAQSLLLHARIDCLQFKYGKSIGRGDNRLRDIQRALVEHDFELFRVVGPGSLAPLPKWSPSQEDSEEALYLALHSRLSGQLGLAEKKMPDLAALAQRHGLRLRGVVHVGAHKGGEVETYRTIGVRKMLLVEANPEIHAELAATYAADPAIVTVQAAASDRSGSITLRVAEFSQASSLLRPALTVKLYPFTRTVKQIEVEARRLDRIVSDAGLRRNEFNLLNIDVQGAELMVLRGAEELLPEVEMVNVQVNFNELYEDAAQIEEIDEYLGERGFRRVALACPYDRSWGDAVYVREDSPPDYSPAADCRIPPLAELLATHLGRIRGGTFVEVGAYDGHTASSTSFLADLGWRGLYVEAVPEYAAMCAQRHRANNRVDVANVAVGRGGGTVEIELAGALSTTSAEHAEIYRGLAWAKPLMTGRTLRVPRIGLDDLLAEYGIEPRFDLLVVDVEGAEAEVFDSFSLDKWRPRMLIVDLDGRHPDLAGHAAIASRGRALREHLTRSGYGAVWEDQIRTVLVDQRAEDSRSPIARLISRFRPTTR